MGPTPAELNYSSQLMAEAEKLKPSDQPAYWAKKSCTKCYGRGVVGTITTTMKGNNRVQQELVCQCTRRQYQKWLQQTLADLKKKSDATTENHS